MPIKYENVSFTYNAKTPFSYEALSDVSLDIIDGSFTAIVGKTGCGKSTLIQQLNGLLVPTSGEVIINDYVVAKSRKRRTKKIKELRKLVGLVFQFPEYQLFEETVEKDVAFGPKNFGASNEGALKSAHEALRLVGLDESFYKRSPFDLSGGERRRVAIAGILALNPNILVLDEPTAGLDPRGAREMMALFKGLHDNGTTVILVTHDMNIVLEYSDTVIVMEDGEVREITTPLELFNKENDRYSLETPLLYKFVKSLSDKGMALDIRMIKDIDSLAAAIALAPGNKR
ncbi:MAG: energy-coupling factor transporter ATPase [Epsilonproteobacteria bacterium]|nr:energy-coupling factor transporter ATPase [Bacilli bacterium]NCA95080.1 energy-coupling factor transporter ATPase [Campylobacterota bacterium]HPY38676.1 energy-coupling factor transporter ATPase [Bacilli bacterium]